MRNGRRAFMSHPRCDSLVFLSDVFTLQWMPSGSGSGSTAAPTSTALTIKTAHS